MREICFKLAQSNMWATKPIDSTELTTYSEELYCIALGALDNFSYLGVTEIDISHCIEFIENVFSSPPLGTDAKWFRDTLYSLLELAHPDEPNISNNSKEFAKALITGLIKYV